MHSERRTVQREPGEEDAQAAVDTGIRDPALATSQTPELVGALNVVIGRIDRSTPR